jgi:DNA invertase Pin-like site-specific DNA recombinase
MQTDEQSVPATSERVVVVYERVSTDRQDIARQAVQRERAQADNPKREIVVLQDDGVSAFKVPIFDRPGGRALCARIEAGAVEAVYADAQDRLSRGKLAEWVNFKALCDDAGTRIVLDGRELRADDEADELLGVIGAITARRESREKAHRVRGGMRKRAERGLSTGGPSPYGYRYEDGGLVVVHDEAELVRRIFTEYVGGKSQRQIARDLHRDGVRTKRGGRWSQAVVARVIANPLYKGSLRYCGEEHDGVHEAIIGGGLWDEAEQLRSALARTKGGGRGNVPKGRHLFRHGILRCGRCGEAMVPRTLRPRSKTGRWYEAYLCYGRIRDREACDQPPVPREDIDGAFFRYFETVALDVDATRAQFAAEQSRHLAEAEALRERARREEHEATARLARVRRDYQDGKLDADDWRDQRDELTAELEAARAQAARLDEQTALLAERRLPDAELAVLEYLTELRATIVGRVREGDNVEAVRAALLTLFDRFTLHRFDGETGPPIANDRLLVGDPLDGGYFLEPSVRPEMVAQVLAVHHPSGEPAAVAPTRIALAARENKDANGFTT